MSPPMAFHPLAVWTDIGEEPALKTPSATVHFRPIYASLTGRVGTEYSVQRASGSPAQQSAWSTPGSVLVLRAHHLPQGLLEQFGSHWSYSFPLVWPA